MKNRSSSSVTGNSSSNSIHGLSSSTTTTMGSNNHHGSATTSSTTTHSTSAIAAGTSIRTSDEYKDFTANNNNMESQGLLYDSSATINHNSSRTSNILPISILFLSSILLFGIGWYGPRYWMARSTDDIIARNPPPYQKITTTTDSSQTPTTMILLDPTYNHPVIDPPTISCK